jgi:hypothetical protein
MTTSQERAAAASEPAAPLEPRAPAAGSFALATQATSRDRFEAAATSGDSPEASKLTGPETQTTSDSAWSADELVATRGLAKTIARMLWEHERRTANASQKRVRD